MKRVACMSTGIVVTLLLFPLIVTAGGIACSNETNITCEVGISNLSLAENASEENTGLAGNTIEEVIQPSSEDGDNSSGNESWLPAFPGIDKAILELQVIKTRRVSIRSNGDQGDGDSYFPSISSNGRFVAFESDATNLVNDDTNGFRDVFVHDRETRKTTRVSVKTNGKQGDGGSYFPSISSNGRYVAFHSYATNLVNDDTNGAWDVFVHDRETGKTTRVSVKTNKKQGDDNSYSASISSNGRYVAFHSYATNLVNEDTNDRCDVFMHDRETGKTTRVSVRTDGNQGDYDSYSASISSNGRYVAFHSYATNLVNEDTNGFKDVFATELNT